MTKDKFSTPELIRQLEIENSYLKDKIEALEKMLYNSNLSNLEPKSKTLIDKNGFIKKTIDKRHLSYFEKKKYIFDGEAIGIIILKRKDVLKLIKTLF